MKLPTALCLFVIPVVASPVSSQQEILQNKKPPCAAIDTFTVRWFIDNALNAKRPPSSSCLFYTWGQTNNAQEYAEKNNKTTIWDVWPHGYYNNDTKSASNPLQNIMKKEEHKRAYFSNMSIAFASMCDIYALVMDNNITPLTEKAFDVVNKLGIWFNDEFCALQRGSIIGMKHKVVTQIEAISPQGGDPKPYWSMLTDQIDQRCASPAGTRKVYSRSLPMEKQTEWWDAAPPVSFKSRQDDPNEMPVACER